MWNSLFKIIQYRKLLSVMLFITFCVNYIVQYHIWNHTNIFFNCVFHYKKYKDHIINTFASQLHFFDEPINYFTLKMHKIWRMSFFWNSYTKTHVSNLMHFQEEMVHFFLKNEALRSGSVKSCMEITFH